jgi:SAM-dependent methyltransferase
MKKQFLANDNVNVVHPVFLSALTLSGETFIDEHIQAKLAPNGIPIVLPVNGVFDLEAVVTQTVTFHDSQHSDRASLKNKVRKDWLPKLSHDEQLIPSYKELLLLPGKPHPRVLVIGAGEKGAFYRNLFGRQAVITDIQLLFDVDVVCDAHLLPFENERFDLVILAQVVAHLMRPWDAALEVQRVTKMHGFIRIESPFAFPLHGEPFDFYRFTLPGIVGLFRQSKVAKLEVTEGACSGIAVAIESALKESTTKLPLRRIAVLVSRVLFFWLKYIEKGNQNKGRVRQRMAMPKGYKITLMKQLELPMNDIQVIQETEKILNSHMATWQQ